MNEYGLIADNGTIRFARMLLRPPEQVWEFLTRPTLLGSWLAEGTVELHVGGYVNLSFEATEGPERTAAGLPISGVVTRCSPPESIAFAWTDANTISHVAFELERRGAEVLFLLTHAGLPMKLAIPCAASWHSHLNMLEARLRNLQPESHGSCVRRVLAHYKNYRDARLLRARSASDGNLERTTAR